MLQKTFLPLIKNIKFPSDHENWKQFFFLEQKLQKGGWLKYNCYAKIKFVLKNTH
jgi:hypothetical protein